jgi:hypothetical protein
MERNIWTFETSRFTVTVDALPEDVPPEDTFFFDEDIEAVRNGEVEYFCARAQVLDEDGKEIASDYLGGCAYKSFDDFRDHFGIAARGRRDGCLYGSYFSDMVYNVVREAREIER